MTDIIDLLFKGEIMLHKLPRKKKCDTCMCMEKAIQIVESEKQRREELHEILRTAQKTLLKMTVVFHERRN